MKSNTSRSVGRSATSSSASARQPAASGQAGSSEVLIADRRLDSLVRNASDTGHSSQAQPVGKQERRRQLLAEFADESLESQSSGAPPSAQPARSFSLGSLKQPNQKEACRHQKQIDASGLSDEFQRLMTDTIDESKDCSQCRAQADSNNRPTDGCNCCACFASKRELRTKHAAALLGQMSTSAQTSKLIPAYFIAELLGTFLLVVIGDGAVAAYILTKRQVDLFCVCFAFGVGAMIGTFASAKISGAHLNPAATLANALQGKLKWSLVPVYMAAQYLGGFLAALVLFLNYSEAIGALDGGQRAAFGSANATGAIFATYPAPYVSAWGSLLDQIVGTAVLLFSLSAVCDTRNRAMDERQQPLVVAFVIGLICVAFSPNCGAIFNPARDLSPRLLTAIFGYSAVWEPIGGAYWLLAGVVGPHLGAIIGVFAYECLIGSSLRAFERHAQHLAELHDGHHALACQKPAEKPAAHQSCLAGVQHYQPARPSTPPIQPRLSDYGAAR